MINNILNKLTNFIPLFWNKYLTISILSFLILVVYLLKYSKTCYNPNDKSGYECTSISDYDRTNDIETITDGGEYIAFQGLFGTIRNTVITCITGIFVLFYIFSSIFDYEQYWIFKLTVISVITFIINYIFNGKCPNPNSDVLYTCDGERNLYFINWNSKILWLLFATSILTFLIYWRKVKNGSITIMGESNITPSISETHIDVDTNTKTVSGIGEPVQFPSQISNPVKSNTVKSNTKTVSGIGEPVQFPSQISNTVKSNPVKSNPGKSNPGKSNPGKSNTKTVSGIGEPVQFPSPMEIKKYEQLVKSKAETISIETNKKFKVLEDKILRGEYDNSKFNYDNNLTKSENIIANQREQSIKELKKYATQITGDINQLVTPAIKSGGNKKNIDNIRELYIHKYT